MSATVDTGSGSGRRGSQNQDFELNLASNKLAQIVCAMLAGPDKQPRQSLAGNHKRGVWPGQQGSPKRTILLEFKVACREGVLAGNEDRSRRDGHGAQPGKYTADCLLKAVRYGQVAHVEFRFTRHS